MVLVRGRMLYLSPPEAGSNITNAKSQNKHIGNIASLIRRVLAIRAL